MSTTSWRDCPFRADPAVLRLKQLDAQDLITCRPCGAPRPPFASAPQAQEHVTDEGSKASSFAKKLTKAGIDGSMLEAVKGDMTPGTSALVLLSVDAAVNTVARAFEGHAMELMRSDLSVPQETDCPFRGEFPGRPPCPPPALPRRSSSGAQPRPRSGDPPFRASASGPTAPRPTRFRAAPIPATRPFRADCPFRATPCHVGIMGHIDHGPG